MSYSNYKNRKTLQLKEASFMGASFLCGLIRIPDFVQNLFLNKKSYRLWKKKNWFIFDKNID